MCPRPHIYLLRDNFKPLFPIADSMLCPTTVHSLCGQGEDPGDSRVPCPGPELVVLDLLRTPCPTPGRAGHLGFFPIPPGEALSLLSDLFGVGLEDPHLAAAFPFPGHLGHSMGVLSLLIALATDF